MPLREQPGHHGLELLLCCAGGGLWVQVSPTDACLAPENSGHAGRAWEPCCDMQQRGGRALPLSLPRATPRGQLLAGQRAVLSWGPGGVQGWTGCLSLVRSPALQLNLALAP